MEKIKERKRQTPEYFDEKISKLEKEIAEIDQKISTLKDSRKAIIADINSCKDEQILCLVKNSKLNIEEIKESIRLASIIQKSGISTDDVQGFTKEEIE